MKNMKNGTDISNVKSHGHRMIRVKKSSIAGVVTSHMIVIIAIVALFPMVRFLMAAPP